MKEYIVLKNYISPTGEKLKGQTLKLKEKDAQHLVVVGFLEEYDQKPASVESDEIEIEEQQEEQQEKTAEIVEKKQRGKKKKNNN